MAKAVSCVAINAQPGSERFLSSVEKPLLKHWRCDLTALSKKYNLYFVACDAAIHVYQPQFPNQTLSKTPALTIHPPTTSPGLKAGNDPGSPHSVNRLLVDFLGREEVLLAVCDDGDVVGYRVSEIQHALEKRQPVTDGKESTAGNSSDIRVFLHRNVGLSAWGLAVHRDARLIAISANTAEITVIAYALADVSTCRSESSDSVLEDVISVDDGESQDFPFPRRRDHVITLVGRFNIPAISFDNNGTDPTGRWLFSSSIKGETHLWDLYSPETPMRTIRVGRCDEVTVPTQKPDCMCHVEHASWSAMFVDTRSCHQTYSVEDALGMDPNRVAPCYWDVTLAKNTVIVGSRRSLSDEAAEIAEGGIDDIALAEDMAMEISSGTGDTTSEESQSESADTNTELPNSQSLFIPESLLDFPNPFLTSSDTAVAPSSPGMVVDSLETSASPGGDTDSDDNYMIPELDGDGPPLYLQSYCEMATASNHQDQPQSPPCIIVTKEEIYLLQRPLDSAGDLSDPIITMRRPLLPTGIEPHETDRNCYAAQIPELGIFIVASPMGKAAIFSLTRFNTTEHHLPLYGFRMDHLVPRRGEFKCEEWLHERLVGVAVGPVQGMLDTEDQEVESRRGSSSKERSSGPRRWRLMMYYTNHTVLSYELGKFPEGGSPGVGDLVV
ncbi:hypothetical protein BDV95DRAFT_612450 [Massariosphaeria phaeospora]|uniref:Uncharacterized protein n=1 Tax=Massariosphaeria phaeospora TaxID=100035 RepID=A0A7C8I1J6_9PLEO|nr:hypothetical protein BDV95DRAFT_612450 [Massariosphaeria phaeospora]